MTRPLTFLGILRDAASLGPRACARIAWHSALGAVDVALALCGLQRIPHREPVDESDVQAGAALDVEEQEMVRRWEEWN